MLPVRFLIAGSAILLWLYLNIRKRPSAITPELRKALEVYDRDPVTGQQQLDSYFQKQGEKEDEARKLLWVQAQTDARSAKELRRRLLQDMKTHQFARTEVSKYSAAGPAMIADIDESERSTRAELAKIDALIEQLRHG